jgi:hypothetical protein
MPNGSTGQNSPFCDSTQIDSFGTGNVMSIGIGNVVGNVMSIGTRKNSIKSSGYVPHQYPIDQTGTVQPIKFNFALTKPEFYSKPPISPGTKSNAPGPTAS